MKKRKKIDGNAEIEMATHALELEYGDTSSLQDRCREASGPRCESEPERPLAELAGAQ